MLKHLSLYNEQYNPLSFYTLTKVIKCMSLG